VYLEEEFLFFGKKNFQIIPSVNFASSSLFPIALAAQHICRSNSSSRRIHRTTDPN
jgi:hypothetical protein